MSASAPGDNEDREERLSEAQFRNRCTNLRVDRNWILVLAFLFAGVLTVLLVFALPVVMASTDPLPTIVTAICLSFLSAVIGGWFLSARRKNVALRKLEWECGCSTAETLRSDGRRIESDISQRRESPITPCARTTLAVGVAAGVVAALSVVLSWPMVVTWFRLREIRADPALVLAARAAPEGSAWNRALQQFMSTREGQGAVVSLFVNSAVGRQDRDWAATIRESESASIALMQSPVADYPDVLIAWHGPDDEAGTIHIEPLKDELAIQYLSLLEGASSNELCIPGYAEYACSVLPIEDALVAARKAGPYDTRRDIREWLKLTESVSRSAVYLKRR